MIDVQRAYQQQMDALSPSERVARSVAMFNWSREILARQILAEMGPISHERLKWEVALRMYGAEREVREWIERQLDRVST
jgi:hypothetical protein